MALRTLGTNANNSLVALPAYSQVLAAADVAAIAQAITDDRQFASIPSGWGAGPTAVIGTGSTHSNATLDTLVGVSGAALAQVAVGDLVLGTNIPAGTYVTAKASPTSLTMSQAATDTAAGKRVAFVRPYDVGSAMVAAGQLFVPNRGVLKILPGDIVAIDNTGWPVLVSAAAIGYAGSLWTLT